MASERSHAIRRMPIGLSSATRWLSSRPNARHARCWADKKMKIDSIRKLVAISFGTHVGSRDLKSALNANPIPTPAMPVRTQPAKLRSCARTVRSSAILVRSFAKSVRSSAATAQRRPVLGDGSFDVLWVLRSQVRVPRAMPLNFGASESGATISDAGSVIWRFTA